MDEAIEKGKIACRRIGRRLLIRFDDLVEYLEALPKEVAHFKNPSLQEAALTWAREQTAKERARATKRKAAEQ